MARSKRNSTSKRPYRYITPNVVAKFHAQRIVSGNNTRAVQDSEADYGAPEQRAMRIITHSKGDNAVMMIDNGLQQIAEDAIQRVSDVVNGADEALALKASTYVIDHLRGKAVQRSENKNMNISIESVL